MFKYYRLLGPAVATLSMGCSSDETSLNPQDCVGGWQPLIAEEGATLQAFAATGSRVYFSSIRGASATSDGLQAVELGRGLGGAEPVAPELLASELWAEPNGLTVRSGRRLVNLNLLSGTEEVLFDSGAEGLSAVSATTVSGTEFYWSLGSEQGIEIHRGSRMGGDSSVLYSSDEGGSVQRLDVVGEYLLATLGQAGVLRIALERSDAELLPPIEGRLVGVGPSGLYYQKQAPLPASGGQPTQQELWHLPVDGSAPRRMWTTPAGYFLGGVGSNPDGAQVVLGGTEVFDDGSRHPTLRELSSGGETRLLACDPEEGTTLGVSALGGSGTVLSTTRNGGWQLAFVEN